MGGARAIVVMLVGGVAVLLQVWVMFDNQYKTEQVTATVGTWFVVHFERKGWSLRSESKSYSRSLAYLWRRPIIFLLLSSNGNAHPRSKNITLINWLSRNYGDVNKSPRPLNRPQALVWP